MNDLKSGINNLVKETEQNNQPSNLEQSKQYLTNKGYITSIETPDGDYYEDINPAQLNAILLSIK